MIRRFNFTGRKKLPSACFELATKPGPPRRFTAEIALEKFNFPEESKLYFEATSSGLRTVRRFPWGTVATPKPPDDCRLDELGENVRFDFKVVDESGEVGRILGMATGLSVRLQDGGDGREPLLPVNPVELRQEVWRILYNGDTPWLEVNSSIPEIMTRAQSDPVFMSLTYPAALREILTRALIVNEQYDPSNLDRWEGRWLSFAMRFHPDVEPPPEADQDHQGAWIETVVAGFCDHYALRHRFAAAPDAARDDTR